jgi:NAD(P)H-dependent nitrite reductase small subunit
MRGAGGEPESFPDDNEPDGGAVSMTQECAGSGFVDVARLEELPAGTSKIVWIGDRTVALFNVGGTVYATDNNCPHSGGPLGKGTLEGDVVTCPWHLWEFNVRTGVNIFNPEERIETFPVMISDGQILVKA